MIVWHEVEGARCTNCRAPSSLLAGGALRLCMTCTRLRREDRHDELEHRRRQAEERKEN